MQVSSLGRGDKKREKSVRRGFASWINAMVEERRNCQVLGEEKMSRIQWSSKGVQVTSLSLSKRFRDRLVVAWQPQEADKSNFLSTCSVVDSAGSAFSLRLVERHLVQEQAHCRLS